LAPGEHATPELQGLKNIEL